MRGGEEERRRGGEERGRGGYEDRRRGDSSRIPNIPLYNALVARGITKPKNQKDSVVECSVSNATTIKK